MRPSPGRDPRGGPATRTKAPEGTGGDLRSTGPAAANKSTVAGRRRVPRSPALRPANLVPGTGPRIAPRTSLAVQPAPSGKTKCTGRAPVATTGLSTNLSRSARKLSPKSGTMWTVCGYISTGAPVTMPGAPPRRSRAPAHAPPRICGIIAPWPSSSSRIQASSSSSARPVPASRRSRSAISHPMTSCRPMPIGRRSPATRPTSG